MRIITNHLRWCEKKSPGKSSSLIIILFVMLASLFTTQTSAQITIDGNPSDWCTWLGPGPTYPPSSRLLLDPVNSQSDNIWTGGSSDVQDVPLWRWTMSGSNDKNDIKNAGFTVIGTKVYFFADRYANNGDANIGIWLLQSATGTNPDGTFSGVHTNGDILLVSAFTNGGTQPGITAYRWDNGALNTTPIAVGGVNLNASVNLVEVNTPTTCWTYQGKTSGQNPPPNVYPMNTFFEGFIDLAPFNISPCLASIIISTRNSQSLTASLEDLVLDDFNSTPIKPILSGNSICASLPNTGTISTTTSQTNVNYQLKKSSDNSNVQDVKAGTGSALQWTGLTAGSYYVVATTANSTCSSTSDPATVTVKPTPVGSASPASICSGATTSVTLNSTIAGTTFTWTAAQFSGATITGFSNCASACGTSIAQTLTNTGSTNGVVRYTVTPTADGCPGTPFTVDVTVKPTPVGSASPASICSGATTSVTLNSTVAGTTFTWTAAQFSGATITGFSNCASACGTSIAQTLTNTGSTNGVVRYTVTPTADGCPGTPFTVDVTVKPTPVGSASPASICSGATTSVTLNSTVAGTTFTWTAAQFSGATITGFSNCASACGTSIAQTLTNTGSTNGVVRYTVTPTADGCPGTPFTVDVTVKPKPVGSASPASICSGATTSVTLNSTVAGTTFTWTAAQFSGATITGFSNCASACGTSIAQTLTNTGSTNGVVRYTVTPTADGCPGTPFTVDVTVKPTPVGSASPASICSGATTSVTLNSTVAGTTFTWTAAQFSGATITGFSNCASACGTSIAQTLTNTGTTNGVVRYTVTPTADGCPGTPFTVDVTVKPKPVGSASPASICSGATTSVTLNSTVAGTTFTWTAAQFSGATITGFSNCASACGTSIAQTLTNTGSTNGVVRYTVTPTADGCPGTPFTVDVTVKPKPVGSASPASICSGATTSVTLNSTVAGTTFTWTAAQFSGATITGFSNCASACGTSIAQTLTNTGSTNGVVRYTVTPTADGCPGTPFTVDVTVKPHATANAGTATPQCRAIGNPTTTFGTNTFNLTGSGTNGTPSWSVQTNATGFTVQIVNGNTYTPTINISGADKNGGSVTLRLTVTSNNGCNNAQSDVTLTMNPLPLVRTLLPGNFCPADPSVGGTIKLQNAQAGVSYQLMNQDNIPATPVQAPKSGHIEGAELTWTGLQAANSYGVVGTVIATSCESTSGPAKVEEYTPPIASVAPKTKCASDPPVTISVVTNPAAGAGVTYTYSWSVPVGVADPGNVTSFSASVAGNYTATVTRIETGCQDFSTGLLTVNPNPNLTTDNSTFCASALGSGGNLTVDLTAMTRSAANPTGPIDGDGGAVSYHSSQSNANAGIGLSDQSAASVGLGTNTFWARSTFIATDCFSIRSFDVIVVANPLALVLTGSEICDTDPGTGTITSTTSENGVSYQLKDASHSDVQAPKIGDGNPLQWTGLNAGNGYYVVSTKTSPRTCTATSDPVNVSTRVCSFTLCTYTQGYYGNANGTSCNGTTGNNTTTQLINQALNSYPSSKLVVGKPGRSVYMDNAFIAPEPDPKPCIIAMLPSNGGAKELSVLADLNICSLPASYLKNGKIDNNLLTQTITLGLNMGIPTASSLGNFELMAGGSLTTAEVLGGCGSTVPKPRYCEYSPIDPFALIGVVNEYKRWTINAAVVNAIPGPAPKTVSGLFELANQALANVDGIVGFEAGVSLSAILSAVDAINNGFDKCRVFIGWNVPPLVCPPIDPNAIIAGRSGTTNQVVESRATTSTQEIIPVDKLSVAAFPNPFTDQVRFTIESPVSGVGTLEVYNMLGQKLQTVFKGLIHEGKGQVIEFNAPAISKTNLIYIMRVGNHQVTGKLLFMSK